MRRLRRVRRARLRRTALRNRRCRGFGGQRPSIDGAPLAESSRILVAHVTDAANSGAVFDGPESRSWLEQGVPPALVRRGTARIELALAGVGDGIAATVYRLSPTGHRIAEVPASLDTASGRLSFTADTGHDAGSATLFYEIVR